MAPRNSFSNPLEPTTTVLTAGYLTLMTGKTQILWIQTLGKTKPLNANL